MTPKLLPEILGGSDQPHIEGDASLHFEVSVAVTDEENNMVLLHSKLADGPKEPGEQLGLLPEILKIRGGSQICEPPESPR